MTPAPDPPTLSELQRDFLPCLADLIRHIYESGYTATMGEGYVGDTDPKRERGPHRKDGGHYKRIACDLNVFHQGVWLKKGNEPIWSQLGRFWMARHPEARWTPNDPNHFGLRHGGVF